MTETDRNNTMTDQTIPVDKLRALLDGEGSATDKIQAIYDDLLPSILPDPLFGARATHSEWGEGIVASYRPDRDGEVRFAFPDEWHADGADYRWVDTSDLTFRTPESPDHPAVLTTEADYENAPAGTIVEGALPWAKGKGGRWETFGVGGGCSNSAMAGEARQVLRWVWEA